MALLIKIYSNFFKQTITKLIFTLKRTTVYILRVFFSGKITGMEDSNQMEELKYDSSDSSDEKESANYVLYKNRPEWKDVQPVPQDDGTGHVVKIAYSEKFTDVYNYFRAILQSGEKSLRSLELVTDAISLNPANYTVWIYRLEIVLNLDIDLHTELDYISNVIREYTKNYQVWQYRKNIVELLNEPSNELEFTAEILVMDAKNYHAWQYRQWVLTTYSNLMEKELDFVEDLLSKDMRNNSAWNQRYFVIYNSDPSSETIEKELIYTFNKIKILSKNESAWNYLRGLLLYSENGILEEKVRAFCNQLYKSGNRSPYLLSCMIDWLDADESTDPDNVEKVKFVLKLCFELATKFDPIRRFYWAYISSDIQKKYNIIDHDTKINVLEETFNEMSYND
ncbi:protein farnesyltransferase/geranylgeranyltransferase type-1 subunit alpha [Adelges cooleyi]|uniref:protein farnesyltransferase/geranylgeranyltransferase type-1 subunit alpha n=1 Tax=Adelges cooleyi TaxID=133065 RepID=UPI00217FC3E7|nr:protein farnesyltransferase/geranylgeranyltransferase type-1 subunit alpha [Adelges cooleyi]